MSRFRYEVEIDGELISDDVLCDCEGLNDIAVQCAEHLFGSHVVPESTWPIEFKIVGVEGKPVFADVYLEYAPRFYVL